MGGCVDETPRTVYRKFAGIGGAVDEAFVAEVGLSFCELSGIKPAP
jgi:hypothetical protein